MKLWLLLKKAGISPEAVKVAFYAQDGYTTDLQIDTAHRGDIILAYANDGKPLNEVLRLVVPGKWGYKWISHVTVIELVDYNFLGRWESQGYSDEADVALGAPTPKDLQSLFANTSRNSPSAAVPPPFLSQPSVPSPAPSQKPSLTPNAPNNPLLPIKAGWATALLIAIVIAIFGVIIVRKRTKQANKCRN